MKIEEDIERYEKLRRLAMRGTTLIIIAGLILLLALAIGEEYTTIYWSLVIAWVILKVVGIIMIVGATIKRIEYFDF